MRRSRGFTLVEIMMVLGIVGLLASIAVTNLVRNRVTANENMTVTLIVSLRTACIAYYGAQAPNAFPQRLEDLGNCTPPFMEPTLMNAIGGQKAHRGYWYVYQRVDPLKGMEGFTIMARPGEYGRSGTRSFFMDRNGRIFVTFEDREADINDPSL